MIKIKSSLFLTVAAVSVSFSGSLLARELSRYETELDWPYRIELPDFRTTVHRPIIIPEEPEIVEYISRDDPGTVIIDTKSRMLYFLIGDNEAIEYPIAVGKSGFAWKGVEKVSRIEDWPDWIPPKEMRARHPKLPKRVRGGLNNPLGAVAIYLGNTLYRIHGTNDPKSIGKAASSGCFRMLNEHAIHLASMIEVGTVVKVK